MTQRTWSLVLFTTRNLFLLIFILKAFIHNCREDPLVWLTKTTLDAHAEEQLKLIFELS